MPKEHPILFNGDMVRALLDGRKTQTRRIVKPTKDRNGSGCHLSPCEVAGEINAGDYFLCPYGQPGDQLWVRETFQGPLVSHEEIGTDPSWAKDMSPYEDVEHCAYRASGDSCEFFDAHLEEVVARWKPSIHMPRWASRITLEIVSVRVERLQDISEADAKAEGVNGEAEAVAAGLEWFDKPRRAFRFLWESINGAESWDANPWVWVVEFKRVEASQ